MHNRKLFCFESALYISAVILFLLLIAFQVILSFDKARKKIAAVDYLEGVSIEEYDSQAQSGTITLSLADTNKPELISVLVNGEKEQAFSSLSMNLVVTDNSVIEVDGRLHKEPFKISVSKADSNISYTNKNEIIVCHKDISFITRVKIIN